MSNSRSAQQIIEDQILIWSAHEKKKSGSSQISHPVITISRAFGARGKELARRIGFATGFQVWDKELVQAVAEEVGGDARMMDSLDERRRSAIDDAIRSMLVGSDHTNVQYFRGLMRVLRTISQHGSAVIVGRGANFALRPAQCLRVRVTAPVAWRVSAVAERTGEAIADARTRVVARDNERADYIYHHFRSDIESSSAYDITLNAAQFDLDQMAMLTLAAYEARFGKRVFQAQKVPFG